MTKKTKQKYHKMVFNYLDICIFIFQAYDHIFLVVWFLFIRPSSFGLMTLSQFFC